MEDIALQDLIYQVKRELLAPNPKELAKDPNPLFMIDRIELEIAVSVSHSSSGGIKLSVLNFAEMSVGGSLGQERGNVVKVSLSPLLSREEILKEALLDPKVKAVIKDRAEAWVKGGNFDMAGERE